MLHIELHKEIFYLVPKTTCENIEQYRFQIKLKHHEYIMDFMSECY